MRKCKIDRALEALNAARGLQYPAIGYLYFAEVKGDGETLSFESVRSNWRQIVAAHIQKRNGDKSWQIAACDINWEDGDMTCAHSGKPIECAYPKDETEESE